MIRPGSVPDATAAPEHHADYLEYCALRSAGRMVAVQEYVRDLRLGNAGEAVVDSQSDEPEADDPEAESSIAQSAIDELDERRRNFGSKTKGYPFEVSANSIRLKPKAEESLYVFLALLSWYGKDAGPAKTDGEKIFEDVCAKAAEYYLGGPGNRVRSLVFGFPRRIEPKGFADALDQLCKRLGEGGRARRSRGTIANQKDGKLDIVTWVEFEDARHGKVIAFGQCATGRNWYSKISELPLPGKWIGLWMDDLVTVDPIRSFFVPHRVERAAWFDSCALGGVLFDRCRIASLAQGITGDLRSEWSAWSAHVLKEMRSDA